MFCPNTSDPNIKAEFDRYAELLGSNKIAGLLYHKNNGNFLDKTPNGEDSILFQQLVRITGDISKALKVKAQYYTDAYLAKNNWLESGIEPIGELDSLATNSRLLAQYQADSLETKYALERLPEGGSAFVTDIQFKNRKQSFVVKNKHIKPAAGVSNGVRFWMPSIDTNTKKYIVDAYFRLDPNKMPYYPFSLGNSKSNIQRVKLINSEFEDGQEVVRYNSDNDTIEFGKDTLTARTVTDSTKHSNIQSLGEGSIKEGVDFVFEQNPELENIGNQQQYSQYLETIFPKSEVDNILYHGSSSKNIESFDENMMLTGEGLMAFGKGFYFTQSPTTGKYYSDSTFKYSNQSEINEDDAMEFAVLKDMYKNKNYKDIDDLFVGKKYAVLLNIKNPIDWETASNEERKRLMIGEYGSNDSVIHHSQGFKNIHGDQSKLENLLWEKSMNEEALSNGYIGDPDEVLTEIDRKNLIARNKIIDSDIKKYDPFVSGETHYIIPKSDQIHILGSKKDIERFKNFVRSKSSNIQSLGETVDAKLDADKEIISRYEGLIDVINKSLSEKTGRRDTLLARRDRLKEKIEQLKTDGTNRVIIQQAKEDVLAITARLNDIDANLYKELNEDQLWNALADLQELGAYIRGWDGLAELLDAWNIPLEEIRDTITKTSGELGNLHIKYLDLIKRTTVQYANKVSYRADFSDKLFNALEDESLVSRMVFGAAMSNSELVKIVDDIIKEAAYKINEETLNKDKELTNWLNKIQKHLGIKDEIKISERFHQLDKNGKWTGGIVSKIKQDYFDTVSELAEKANSTCNWSPFFKFLSDNTYEMLDGEFKAYIKQKEAGTPFNIAKISSQKNTKGEYVFQEKDFIKQEELYNKYLSHKEAYKKETLESGSFTDSTGDFLSEDHENTFLAIIADWDMKNDPWYKSTGRNKNPFAHYRIRDRIDSKWFDAKFAAIEKDPLLKEFYDFYRDRMKDNDASLPYHKKEQSNLIYSVRKTMAEELVGNRGMAKMTALMKDKAIGLVMAESQSDIEGRAIVGDKIYKNIPVGMLYTSLTGEERSPNIFKALKKHTDVAVNYKYKVKVEPIANAAQDIIDNMAAVRGVNTDEGRTLKKNKHTDKAHMQKAALFNTRARLQYLVDATLHGESQAAPDLHGKGVVDSTGKTMKLSGSKMIDSLIKLKYLSALSLPNVISPTVNLAVGTVNNYSYAAGGVDFDSISLTKAYPKMFAAISKTLGKAAHSKDFKQVITWLVRLDVLPDINSAAFEDSATWDKWLTILQSKGEYINQGATMIAYLMHNKIKDKNGKDVSLLDAYKTKDGQLIWNTELMGEQSKTEANEIISKDGRGVNIYRLSQKIKGINEYIHGDYSSKQEIKKTAPGRAIALFKTWIFQTTEHRFGKERYESRLQRNVKGRYRSFVSATTKEGIEISIKKILPLLLKAMVSGKAFDVLSDIDKVNLKRNLRELQILGAITLITMMAMGAGDDEDDPVKMRALNILINLMSKTQSDLEFYLNPASFSSVANNAIPIVGTLTDMTKIVSTFYGTILGDGIYKTGPFKGQSKFIVATGRAFPITNGAVKMWNYSAQQFNFGTTR